MTTTSYTTVNPKPTYCAPDTCPRFKVCTVPPGIKPAIDSQPTFSPRSPSRLQKRVEPTDPLVIKTLDLTDPDRFTLGSNAWWKHAQTLVMAHGSQNYPTGDSSSTYYAYPELTAPLVTGSGPSWGCTSLIIISDRGVWIGHFWENPKMMDQPPDRDVFKNDVLGFIRNGGVNGFEGLRGFVSDLLFKGPRPGPAGAPRVNEPLFLRAFVFSPMHRSEATIKRDRPPGQGGVLTDPLYYDQIQEMKRVLVELIPGFTAQNQDQLITVAKYMAEHDENEILNVNPWKGLLTFRFAPRHIYRLPNGQCRTVRAVELRNERRRIFYQPWTWPSPGNGPQPDGAPYTCPPNINDILRDQGNPQQDPHTLLDPFGPAPPGAPPPAAPPNTAPPQPTGTVVNPTPSPKPPSPPPPPPPPSPTKGTGPSPTCKNWKLNPTGPDVGTDCDGDPNKTVTVNIKHRRAVQTVF